MYRSTIEALEAMGAPKHDVDANAFHRWTWDHVEAVNRLEAEAARDAGEPALEAAYRTALVFGDAPVDEPQTNAVASTASGIVRQEVGDGSDGRYGYVGDLTYEAYDGGVRVYAVDFDGSAGDPRKLTDPVGVEAAAEAAAAYVRARFAAR